PGPLGTVLFGTRPTPGWAHDGSLALPRDFTFGPLPRTLARYEGLNRTDGGVVFKYTVGPCEVMDRPEVGVSDGQRFFCRTLNLQPRGQAQQVVLTDLESPRDVEEAGKKIVRARKSADELWIRFQGGPAGTGLAVLDGGRVVLNIPAGQEVA